MENSAQLTMTDMASLVALIEVACSRGAYRAAEMTHVGAVYDRLKLFVAQGTAAPADAEPQSQPQGDDNA
jgi:hypothetical protein